MKRENHLIEKIVEIDNLYLAWYKAKKGKSKAKGVINYGKSLDVNLKILQEQLLTGDVEVGNYNFFYVYEPKKRNISAAAFSERVLHHALMNVCHKIFDRHLIYHTYATRKGKGTYAALDKAREYTSKYSYYAKLDIRKFFDSIDHIVLKNKLHKLFKDKVLLKIFEKIIDSYCVRENKGIPIGNLTSQYFANHYLSDADHFLLEKIKIPAYIRYMDDMLLFENNRDLLKKKVKAFTSFIEKNLLLEFKTVNIGLTVNGIPFLGYKLFKNTVRLNKNSKKRFIKKFKRNTRLLELGIWTEKEYQRHTMPLFAFAKYADSLNIRKNIIFGLEKE